MSLRARVFGAMAALLALTVLAAGAIVAGLVLRPLTNALLDERADVAVYVAEQAASAPDPDATARVLADRMGFEARVVDELPAQLAARPVGRTLTRRGHTLTWWGGRRTPMVIPLRPERASPLVVLWFPVDLNTAPRRTRLGLLLLGIAGVVGASVASRWILRPLDLSVSAMTRVSRGDLATRLPVGDDVAGRMGAAFNTMAERVAGLLDAQRRLMAAVSHELRTPLARIRLEVELLADEGAPAARVASLNDEIREMDGLVEELLEAARLQQGVIALRVEPVDLTELVGEALGAVDLGDRPVVMDVPEGAAARLDRRRVVRALKNLLSNAVRYTPDESELTVRAAADGDALVLEVADRGPGVSEADLGRLFEPFFRADSSRSRASGGLGLGLMLVAQIAEAHGGAASALARDGGGLLVRLRLPGAMLS